MRQPRSWKTPRCVPRVSARATTKGQGLSSILHSSNTPTANGCVALLMEMPRVVFCRVTAEVLSKFALDRQIHHADGDTGKRSNPRSLGASLTNPV